ncbi:PREDICTED: uncharacterized protein LOC109115776 [Nelumbo nucifera]|uniref:Uncharacterized protein LOC109115776 n=1 Tax=Nelumbo nucifera TaxID=4432 RepID=A0A1U8QA49_NELNU|nr:PREDICTED: uncharacterized protein LOC109115776 [Nelumbo nucifera]
MPKRSITAWVPCSVWPLVPGEVRQAKSDVVSSRAKEGPGRSSPWACPEEFIQDPLASTPEIREVFDIESLQFAVPVPSSKVVFVPVIGGRVKKMAPRQRRREPGDVDLQVEADDAQPRVETPLVPYKELVGEKGVCNFNLFGVPVFPIIRRLVKDLQSLQPPIEGQGAHG